MTDTSTDTTVNISTAALTNLEEETRTLRAKLEQHEADEQITIDEQLGRWSRELLARLDRAK